MPYPWGAQNLKVGASPGVGLEGDGHPGFVVVDLTQERLGVIPAGDGQVVRPGHASEAITRANYVVTAEMVDPMTATILNSAVESGS